MDIRWFMRNINEPIARQANLEDNCTGRLYRTHPCVLPCGPSYGRSKTFPTILWEGRFKSQTLLDEQALAACLTYVDLNPVRAGMARTPEASEHTSVQRRIQRLESDAREPQPLAKALFPFARNPREAMPEGLRSRLNDYLELVDWTGRIIRDAERVNMFWRAR